MAPSYKSRISDKPENLILQTRTHHKRPTLTATVGLNAPNIFSFGFESVTRSISVRVRAK